MNRRRWVGYQGICLWAASAAWLTGCGSGTNSSPGAPVEGGTTRVTVVADASADDFPFQLMTHITSLRLVPANGNKVELVTTSQTADLLHVQNGEAPLFTAMVPQGVYTTAGFDDDNILWTYAGYSQQGPSLYFSKILGDANAFVPSVQLTSPLTVSGSTMILELHLDWKSSLFAQVNSVVPWGVAEHFVLSPMTSTPVVNSMIARVVSTSAAGATVLSSDGATLPITAGSMMQFSGVTGIAGLSAGQTLLIDGTVTSDGSVAASRIDLADAASRDLIIGPISTLSPTVSTFEMMSAQTMGPDSFALGAVPFLTTGTTFHVPARFTNVAQLPFTARFDASSLSVAQRIMAGVPSDPLSQPFPPAGSMTLLPQMIDGNVTSVSTSGSFTVYTVRLSGTDSTAALLSFPNTANTQTAPQTVYVYADNSATSTSTPQVGSTARFEGLLFDDGGTLRMDADAVLGAP